ncbi:MAG: NAD-dependent epimerase/dehydratase family protein, partial [Gemmatimonadaceae bacterium]|nr:NAD-dependent epimerase/dehydratase family protein [Chitinophagaceae bacterium]
MTTASKVFITGGTGFLGAYIIRELVSKGFSVRALRRGNKIPSFIDASVFSKVEWVDGDVLDIVALEAGMEGIDTVIHSAAKVSFYASERDELYKTNVEGTANVVNAALSKQVSRFVQISSVAALGRTKQSTIVTEEKKWEESSTNTNYAVSKYMAENEVWRGMAEGLDVIILNPSTILGFGDWNASSAAIFKNAYNEFPWYTSGVNGFVDVEDVAHVTVLLLEKNIVNERFIINSDNWSFRKVFESIADNFGKKRPHKSATIWMGSIAWRLEKLKSLFTGNKPLLTRETAKIAHTQTHFN